MHFLRKNIINLFIYIYIYLLEIVIIYEINFIIMCYYVIFLNKYVLIVANENKEKTEN
jgi:hypothetical protein